MTQINIKLGGNSLAKWDFENPLIVPEELVLAFDTDIYKMENIMLMVTIRNKTTGRVEQFKADSTNNHTIDVTTMVEMGELEVEISSYVSECGEKTKTWRTPNIVCHQIDYEFKVIPELHEIRGAITEVKGILELNNLI
jgi:hypothetical protein